MSAWPRGRRPLAEGLPQLSNTSPERVRSAGTLGLAVIALTITGCGYVGDPKPPALAIPSRVTNLQAIEYGSNILIQFTLPPLTTEGLALKGVRSIDARVIADGVQKDYSVPPQDPTESGVLIRYEIPVQEWIGKQSTITVRATGPKGKAADWSNAVVIPIGAPLPAPVNVQVENAPGGVKLSWSSGAPGYRIYRSAVNAAAAEQAPARIGDATSAEYTDMTSTNGITYRYMVQAVDGPLRQSEISSAAEITPKDVFPPAVPEGVSAVAGTDSIELAWQRNIEDDFAGYNIYRSVDGGAFEKISGPVPTPTYSDRQIERGKTYRYQVTSLDNAGNESARSMAAEAVAQ